MCYYPILESLDAPRRSARHVDWIEGERLAFGFFEVPGSYDEPQATAQHEMFVYVLSGALDAFVGGRSKKIGAGDIAQVSRRETYRLQVTSPFARYVLVCSTPYLENRIDSMSPEEAAQARGHMKAN